MSDFLNPYIAGAPVVEPSMFFGRQDVFDWIEQNLSGRFVNHILVIHGQRRVGKTSVLKQIPNHLPPHFINVFFDLQGRTHTSLDRFQWWLAREICRAIHQARGKSIPVPDHELFAQDSEYLASSFLPEVLSVLGESILLLTFDEFDTLSEPEIQQSLTRPLIAYLRRMFDLPNLNFIFSIGSSGHKLENMQASYTEFFKAALYRKISFLKQGDCSQLITRPVEGMLSYAPPAVERIYAITSGHPYFTQLICHELFSLSQKTSRRTISREDVDSVLEDVIERGTVNLKFVWDEASDLEKWVLSSLAHELQKLELDQQARGIQSRGVCNEKQLASALHSQRVRYSENDLNTALVHLREKDVLTQENRFVVELLRIWLLKNRPLDRVRDELVQVNPIANRYNEIGDEFRELGQVEKALDSFRQALSTDPSNLRAQVSIANLHLEGGNYTQAAQGYEAALRIDGDDIAARSGLSRALLALGEAAVVAGKPAQAEEYYQRILADNPDHPEAHQHLAALYARQADVSLATGEAEHALQQYVRALEHAPDDNLLVARYARAKEEHTTQLINGLVQQSQQAQQRQDWTAALDTIHRALQLAPDDPALRACLETLKDAPRLARIASLQAHAQEMERSQRWDEAVQDWAACLELNPQDEKGIQQSLEHAQLRQKIAGNYSQAQTAIKEERYSQAISLLQGVITLDASYKDAAELLVTCLKVRPKRRFTLPPKWWLWPVVVLVLGVIIIGAVSQWPRITSLVASIIASKAPTPTQAAVIGPLNTATTGTPTAPPTMTAAGQEFMTFSAAIAKVTGGKAPDIQDNFSATALKEYWSNDKGAMQGTIQDGALRLNNDTLLGDAVLKKMNYILQVDLRFNGITGSEWFNYGLRLTESVYGDFGTEYQFDINPSSGRWTLKEIKDPHDQYWEIQTGTLESIENGRWYRLGIVLDTDILKVYWNDQQILEQNIVLFGITNHFGLDPSTTTSATLDIDNWCFWNVDTPEWMTREWITSRAPTFEEDNFVPGEGWQFIPAENEKYEAGKAVLSTTAGETSLTREDIQAANFAIEVTYIPKNITDTTSLYLFLGKDTNTGDMLVFESFLNTGAWTLSSVSNQGTQWKILNSGWVDRTSLDNLSTILVVLDKDTLHAYLNGVYICSYSGDRPGSGSWNAIVLQGSQSQQNVEVEISSIHFWDMSQFTQIREKMVGDRLPDVQDDFSGTSLGEYWSNDEGAQKATLQDGAMRLSNELQVGKELLNKMNYVLQVDLRFSELTGNEDFIYTLRTTPSPDGEISGYQLKINPSSGSWLLMVKDGPTSGFTEVQTGGLPAIEAGQWYELVVMVQNEMFWVFWDDQCITTQGNISLFGTLNAFGLNPATAGKATLDLDNWRLWDLGIPEQMRNDWISISPPTVEVDRFSEGEGWQFAPAGNEKFEAGKAVLYSNGGDTTVSRDDLLGNNIALEVTFNPQDMPASASLIWFLGKDDTTGDHLAFEYQPGDGNWSIVSGENQAWNMLIKGVTRSTPMDGNARIMVVVNGSQVSAFYDDTLLGSVDVGRLAPGTTNSLAIRNNVAAHAQVDIVKLRFWNLDTVEWKTSDWITARKATAILENFTGSQGLLIVPSENERYENTRVVLFTSGGDTTLLLDDLQARNCALEVSFDPRDMPDPASLVWALGMDSNTGEGLSFEYAPSSGSWSISKYENQAWSMLTSGVTQPTSKDTIATIMVVLDGDKVSAYLGGALLGSVESNHPGAGIRNRLTLLSNGVPFAQVDITRIRFWDLGSPAWMRNDWITVRAPTFIEENFSEGEGWQFKPVGNENYKEGRAVLFTDGSETRLARDEMQATDLAIEVSFTPRTMPESASLVLSLRENPNAKDRFFVEFFTGTGSWQIIKVENDVLNKIASGSTSPVPQNTSTTIMVVVYGDHVSAFSGNVYLGSVESGLMGAGTTNELVITNHGGSLAVIDIISIRFWNLDQ